MRHSGTLNNWRSFLISSFYFFPTFPATLKFSEEEHRHGNWGLTRNYIFYIFTTLFYIFTATYHNALKEQGNSGRNRLLGTYRTALENQLLV